MAPQGFKRVWADQPFNLIPIPEVIPTPGSKHTNGSKEAAIMATIHNVFLRTLNSIYVQAPHIKEPKDVKDFLVYVNTWQNSMHDHHEIEETIVFPLFAKDTEVEDIMEPNVNQHAEFVPGLSALEAYVKNVQAGKETYDGSRITQIIDSFGIILTRHLTDEISTLQSLDKYHDKINWAYYEKTVHKAALAHANVEFGIPQAFTNVEVTKKEDKEYFPVPWIAAQIFKWWYIPKHPELWRFSSCTPNNKAKELPFAPLLSG